MIDFRYHLVSLVSVFIALAIGVVLGAGPLGGTLGDTLNNQIVGLREDKAALQQAVTNRDRTITSQETALATVAHSVVEDTLTGEELAVVLLPGSSDSQVDDVRALLDDSGGEVVVVVEIQPTWVNPGATTERATALAQAPAAAGQDEADRLAEMFAGALLSEPSGQPVVDPDPALEALSEGGLITVSRTQPVTAGRVLLIGAGTTEAAGDSSETAEWNLALVRALGADTRLVVAAPADSADSVVGQVRADSELGPATFTVDNLGTAPGPLATVLALAQPQDTSPGHYGTGDGVAAVLPPVPPRVGPAEQPAPAATP